MAISTRETARHRGDCRFRARPGSRELVADDYIYQIKRLAHPRLHSPIFSMMAERIVGLRELGAALQAGGEKAAARRLAGSRSFSAGRRQRVDRYTYRISCAASIRSSLLAGDAFLRAGAARGRPFLHQPGMAEKNLTLDWYPVGTGPFMLTAERSQQPHGARAQPELPWRDLSLPGRARRRGGRAAGRLRQAAAVHRAGVFSREKESIPYWNKFLQGYYDASGISSDSFDQAVRLGGRRRRAA
jgi:oligopeptide transport system substrate-binding protein